VLDIKTIVQNARQAGLAIPAFNIPYLPMLEPVVQAVADQDSFALVETARIEWVMLGVGGPEAVAREFYRYQNPDHVRLHLDHIPVIDEGGQPVDYMAIIQQAIDLGFHSVMVDGSRLPLGDNIHATAQAVTLAHQARIPCEAELGMVFGHDPGPLPPYDELFASGKGFTRVDDARRFVAETGCDWLSVAIGSIHGAISPEYQGQKKIAARLDLDHLEKLYQATAIPLVLHGGSAIPREVVLASFKKGIAKINIATQIRQVYQSVLQSSGRITLAQQAVYQHTQWLVGVYFGLCHTHSILLQELP
jgi:fructose-bisphosphate aldolase class II